MLQCSHCGGALCPGSRWQSLRRSPRPLSRLGRGLMPPSQTPPSPSSHQYAKTKVGAYVCVYTPNWLHCFVLLAGMLLVRKAPQPWVLKLCAYHSTSQPTSNQLTNASVQTALTNHKCTLCLAEAINCAEQLYSCSMFRHSHNGDFYSNWSN